MNKIIMTMGAVITALSLTACNSEKEREKYIYEHVELKVISVDPPKRFTITLEDKDGNRYSAYSKRCSNYENVKVNTYYSLPVTFLVTDDRRIVRREIEVSACTIASDYNPIWRE